jgi:hypothetical protein
MTRGRKIDTTKLVEGLEGSDEAKARLAIFLEAFAGRRTVGEACDALELRERRFYILRGVLLQAALDSLEPRPAGRPSLKSPRQAGPESEIRDLRLNLQAAQIREEIALAMPHLLQRSRKKVGRRRARRSGRNNGFGG